MSQYREAMKKLRIRFRDRLIERILDLEALTQQLRNLGATRSQLDEIVMIVHKLAGTAPSLGYKELGQLARDIESETLQGLKLESPQTVWNQISTSLERLLDHLESLIDED